LAKYLLVDDSLSVRLFLGEALKNVDPGRAEIYEATTRLEAVRLFRENDPDVVFLETRVGSDHGLAILQELLRLKPNACIIVCSGRGADHPEVLEAITKGAYGFLPKPIRVETVRRTLREVETEVAGLSKIL
jgi:two-component system, chemotaxis family, chemotaxis protein CheY